MSLGSIGHLGWLHHHARLGGTKHRIYAVMVPLRLVGMYMALQAGGPLAGSVRQVTGIGPGHSTGFVFISVGRFLALVLGGPKLARSVFSLAPCKMSVLALLLVGFGVFGLTRPGRT